MKALIIGGGIIGGAIAWRLAAEGVNAIVFERARLGQEASSAAAGLIDPQAESQEPGLFFDLAVAAKNAFDAIVDRLARESGIDPEYDRHGLLYVAFDDAGAEQLRARARWQRAAGAPVAELSPAEACKVAPVLSPEITCALHMPANGRTENRKLTMAYIRAAERAGAVFHEGRRVAAIAARAGRAVGVRFDDGSVAEGDAVIVAAGSWSSQIAGLEADAIRIYPVRGQIVCFDARPGLFAPSLFSPEGILVPRRDGRILAGSVFEDAGFNKSVTMDGIARVVSAARKLAPSLAALPFREAWAGLRPASDDLLPVLGPSPSVTGVLYATGHFRSGILLSALTADAIAAIMMGRRPPIDLAPFSPARFQGRPSTRVDPHIKGR